MFRIAFPRTAVAGTTRTLRFDAKELQGYASVSVVYTYTAMPGKMLVDGNGDPVDNGGILHNAMTAAGFTWADGWYILSLEETAP